jgi:hypothetical protein
MFLDYFDIFNIKNNKNIIMMNFNKKILLKKLAS